MAAPCARLQWVRGPVRKGCVTRPFNRIVRRLMERTVRYTRHEFQALPEDREAPLIVFIFDIPYFGACGVFPPFHLLNWRLSTGGGDGGMSPGASWVPFQLSQAEYDALLRTALEPDVEMLKRLSRYSWQRWSLDPEFDQHTDYFEWSEAVCRKHRAAYQVMIAKLNETSNNA